MNARNWLVLGMVAGLAACGGDGTDPIASGDAGEPDAGGPEVDAAACPTGGNGMLAVDVQIEDEARANVIVTGSGAPRTLTASETLTLPAGPYEITAKRVMAAGAFVGAAYQPVVQTEQVCVSADKPASARVVYTREPGSARLWLTQTNGTGSPVMGFDASQLSEAGEQTPATQLETKQPNAGPIRVDALGRLWVGSSTGTLVAFNTARLATSSSEPPDVVLDGPGICESVVPCGPRAIAFDKTGAMWVALAHRIVKLAPESLAASGKPTPVVTITSPEIVTPGGLAFDKAGNLWVGESDGGLLKFNAARLGADISAGAADIAIYAQSGPPVIGTYDQPEGLAFDKDGNLWVGYFTGSQLVRYTPSDLAVSHPKTARIVPTTVIDAGVTALVTDVAIDEAGNLWLPSGQGSVVRIDQAELLSSDPTFTRLQSAEISSVERLTLHSVTGETFIAP